MSTSISKIKNDLLDVICGEMPGVNVSFDYAAATEADSAVIISNMSIQYNNDLELHFQRKLNFSLLMVAKTDADLDEIVAYAETLNGLTTDQSVKYMVVETLEYLGNSDENNKIATMQLSCDIWDVDSEEDSE